MNLRDHDRVAATFLKAALLPFRDVRLGRALYETRLRRAMFALAWQAQSMNLTPRDVAEPNGDAALEAIACAVFSSKTWQASQLGLRLNAPWGLIVDRARTMLARPSASSNACRGSRRRALASSS